jgi:hypothetical protein
VPHFLFLVVVVAARGQKAQGPGTPHLTIMRESRPPDHRRQYVEFVHLGRRIPQRFAELLEEHHLSFCHVQRHVRVIIVFFA